MTELSVLTAKATNETTSESKVASESKPEDKVQTVEDVLPKYTSALKVVHDKPTEVSKL